ncbi:MAG: DUF1778 domain-containing protein [Candidatus Melainabacteria bacterium]|jgi:uncharacterized protein (DUF1778 family)|nr:DUF1778 domain-containing protein [Candidatus Melainabacteria bacterium]
MRSELKKERLDLRLPAAAKEQIERAAELQGRSLSDFVVAAALTQAGQVIEQQLVIKLCLEDSMALAEAFINEPEPNAKAIEAARRYKRKMGKA